ncbi:hypothetical protein HK405_005820 [Cladochytrium tenue]|nr:hypothetical protein HK405_005820 [Cladochytrium tenue]
MWVLAYERAAAALRRLQNATASASSSSSRFTLAAAVLAHTCEIELVSYSSSAHSRIVLRRFRLWPRLDHGHSHAIPAAADSTAAPLILELREDFPNGIITRSWAVLVTSAAPDADPRDATAAATLSALVKKKIGTADAEQSAHADPINRLSGFAALLNRILPASRAFPTLSPAPAHVAATSTTSSYPGATAVAAEPASIDRWTSALATAAVRGLLDWPLPRATSAALPVPPPLHAAIMHCPLLRDALRAFAVGPDSQASPAPPRDVARLDLTRFWIAAVVSVANEALDIVSQRL